MSGASKRRAEDDLDEEEDRRDHTPSEREDESSSPPTSGRKRRRISDETNTPDEDRDETPISDYGSDEEDESLELAATQAIRRKRAHQHGNRPAECGILLNVECINFMCHEHMVFELGPLINFICGKNGSGKSAILTAIVLCLGGKASTTNRGQSLKSFIKEGKDHARIICRIKNEGSEAFQPEEYGDVIEIERFFSRHGSSGFKIKNERGRVISTKKADLESISDHFCLQIDNPLNVLSQDMARQFIASSNASEKYKYFLKGVQLEQLDQDYRLIEEQITNIEANLERKRPDIKVLERNRDKAQAKQDAMQKKGRMREKMHELRRQIAWVQVQDMESFRDDLVRNVEEADAKILEVEQRVTELDGAFQASDAANEAAKEQYSNAQAAVQAAADEKREMLAKRDEIKRETIDAAAEMRTIRGSLTNADASMKKTGKLIQQEEQRLAEVQGGGAAERLRELAQARENLVTAESHEAEHKAQIPELQKAVSEQEGKLRNAAVLKDQRKAETDEQRRNLNDYLRNRDKRDQTFHPNMPRLINAIQQNANRFSQQPIGPVGKHIRLLKPEWSSILEKSIGSNLSGFVVTSKRDSDTLSGLMRQTSCQVPIQIANTIPLQNVADHEPEERFDTILRVIEVDNDMVRKLLILHNAVEQSILIPDLHQASKIMYDGGRLRNVKRCFCLNPHNKRSGYVLSYTKNGEPSQDPVAEFVGSSRMRTDTEAQLQMRQDAVSESEENSRTAEAEFYAARESHLRAKQALEKLRRREKDLLIARQKCEDEVGRLDDATQADTMDQSTLIALREALALLQAEKAVHEESYKDAVIASDEKKARLSAAQAEIDTRDRHVTELEQACEKARSAAARSDKQRTYDLREKNSAIAMVDDAMADRETIDRKRQDLEQRLEDYVTQAQTVSERVNVPEGMTHDKLKDMYATLRKDLERFQQQLGGTPAEITKAFETAHLAYKKGKRDLDSLDNMQVRLKTSLHRRKERWLLFRSHITVRAKMGFTFLLSERSFRGELVTDHKQKLMELRVEPDITRRDGQGRNTRTLSGGEKSFSQICLLLSIWEAMGSPIRCLDEFDVFMDAVNRNLSVNLLVEAARQSVGRQFILISPGTKNDIQEAPDIRAREIAAPERGQTRLSFAQT